jgi:hypothetical protein
MIVMLHLAEECSEIMNSRGRGNGWRAGGEMAQTMYAHMNKKEEIMNYRAGTTDIP